MPQTFTLPIAKTKKAEWWSYIPLGPFRDLNDYATSMKRWLMNDEWRIYAIVDRTHGTGSGVALYKGVKPDAGSIEIGERTWTASRKESRIARTVVLKLKTSEFKILTRSHTPNTPPSSC